MLTLLRVRRAARLRRRPELDGASRPLHRAGSWQPSFCECKESYQLVVDRLRIEGFLRLVDDQRAVVLSHQRLKTTLVAGVFEFSVALLGRAPHAAYLSALPERANLQSGVVGNSPRHLDS